MTDQHDQPALRTPPGPPESSEPEHGGPERGEPERGEPERGASDAADADMPTHERLVTGHAGGPDVPVVGTPIAATEPVTDYTDAGVPTLNYLQDKIDRQYGAALGAAELAAAGDEARTEQRATSDREQAARDRLEEIRRSLHRDS